MIAPIRIIIPIEPTGQMRIKTRIRGNHASTYKDKKQDKREQVLVAYCMDYVPPCLITESIELGVKCFLPIQASKPKKWQDLARNGYDRPPKKPDFSNVIKKIGDVMTMTGFWKDDAAIVSYLPDTEKSFSDQPRWEIEVWSWAGPVSALTDADGEVG